MFSAVKSRRPWFAALLSFLFPFFGMLYLNRGRLALAYFGALLALMVFGFIYLPRGAHPSDVGNIVQVCSLFVSLVAAVHAFFIAKRWKADEPRGFFSRNWLLVMLAFFGLPVTLLIVRTFLYQPFSVPSASMTPTVQVGDFFLASKAAYRSADPQRGDIVVFHPDGFAATTFFKRVIGLPGERVQLVQGTVLVNGKALRRNQIDGRPEIAGSMLCDAAVICEGAEFVEILPSGASYRVLELQQDGPSDDTSVFLVPANSYFVLGDNRDNSQDSRNGLGFIARDQIIGKAAFMYISNHHWTWKVIQ